MRLADVLRATWTAQEKDLTDGQKYDASVCQCCGYAKTSATALECVCDGLNWYLLSDGNVECEAHKFARAGLLVPGASSKPRWFGSRPK